jgi:hypothetical protein
MTFLPLNTNASLVSPPFIATPPDGLSTPVWAKSAGGPRASDNDSGNAIAIDSVGNSYITGKLQGSNIAFGSTSVSTQDLSPDAFVTKLDASGNFLWTKTFGGANPSAPAVSVDVGQGITVDAQGNVYVIGSFQGTMQLSSGALTSNGVSDVFVLKLNGTDGSVTWGKNFGSAGIEQGFAIALDSNNNAYITGTFGDTNFPTQNPISSNASFGTFTLTRSGSTDAFIAKLDSTNGTVAWAKSYGGNGSDTGFGIAATATGVYVTGNTESAGDLNVFAIKLDSSNGNTIWDKNFGGSSEDTGKAIRVDSSGNAYLTGYLKSSTATFGSIGLQSNNINMFAAKLNNLDGSVAWAKSFGEPPSLPRPVGVSSAQYANAIGLDGSANVYLAGSFGDSFLNGVVVLKLNGINGALLWDRSFGGSNFESAYGIAVDSAGNSYITGEFYSDSLILGSQTLLSKGGSDFFVTKLDGQNPIVPTSSPLDLVFYDPIKGQVSFGFVGSGVNIVSEALTGDTPVLTRNSDSATPQFGTDWRLVSSAVDVDKDGVKDLLFANTINNSIAVLFGAARTGTDRQFAYRNSAFAKLSNGTILSPGLGWTVEFASNTIGANNEAGVFWRSAAGDTAIWSFTTATEANGDKSVTLVNSGAIASVGANSGWRAVGDGEFNANTTTREVFWVNDLNGSVATWSLVANRSTRMSKFAWTGQVPTSDWGVVGIGNIGGTGLNDSIVWQRKGGSLMVNWTMVDGVRTTPSTGSEVLTLSATDRIKVLADVDGDGVLDLVGQFDGNGTIGAYALTSGFALKNAAAPRTQYTSNNPGGYRPAKGGLNASTLELVNVAQYNA